ncbi:MAG: nitroreductase family protein [Clostridia bacterium]|nr:nitroreductase family protein [Clostridia bacterium]
MDFNSILALRRSTRGYTDAKISREDLDAIILAGNSAPIGKADYESLHFTAIQNAELLKKIDAAGAKGMGNPDLHPIYGAATLILISGRDGIFPNIEYANTGCIMENMHLKATELGHASIYLWGICRGINLDEELKAELKLPEGFRALSALAVGTPAGDALAPRELTLKMGVDYID